MSIFPSQPPVLLTSDPTPDVEVTALCQLFNELPQLPKSNPQDKCLHYIIAVFLLLWSNPEGPLCPLVHDAPAILASLLPLEHVKLIPSEDISCLHVTCLRHSFPGILTPGSFSSGILSSNIISLVRLSLTTAPKIKPQLILIMLHHYCFHGTDHSLKLHFYFFRYQLSRFHSFLRVGILPNLLTTVSPCPGPSHTQRTLPVEWMNGLVQATFLWEPQCPALFRAWSGLSHRAKPEDEELLAQRLAENWLSELPCIHALLGASGGTWEQSRNH